MTQFRDRDTVRGSFEDGGYWAVWRRPRRQEPARDKGEEGEDSGRGGCSGEWKLEPFGASSTGSGTMDDEG